MDNVIAKHLPKIREDVRSRLQTMGGDVKNPSDDKLTKILIAIHKLLPIPVRMVLKRDRFVKLCLQYKDQIL